MNLINNLSDKSLINKRSIIYLFVMVFLLLLKVELKAQSPPSTSVCGRTVLNFDGSDDYLDVQGTTLDGNAGTWEAWVRKDNWAGQTNGVLFGNDIAFNVTNSMYLSFHAAVGLHFRYGDVSSEPTTGGAIYGQFTNSFAADSWHHIAVSWDHDGGTTTLKMFVDGVEQTGFTAGSRPTHNALIDPGASLNFGFSQGENYLEAGSMAEIRTWNIARTEAEIAADMNNVLTGTETGLTGYWQLDEAQGTMSASNMVSGAPVASLVNSDASSTWGDLSDVKLAITQESTLLSNNATFNYGIVESGEVSAKTFTVTNQGTSDLNLTGNPLINITGADASEFTVDFSATSPSLAAGAMTSFELVFTPGDANTKSAILSIATDETCLPLYELNLTAESVVTTKPDAIIVSNSTPCLTETITLSVDGGFIFGDSEWVWYEGDVTGTPIGTGENINITPLISARYLVRAEDAGNPLTDPTVSETINLIESSLISIEKQPGNGVVMLGDSYTLSVIASGAQLTYQWQKDGVDLSDGVNITGTQTSELNFSTIVAGDTGTYTCIVTNSCNSVTSEEAEITTTANAYVTLPLLEDFESSDGGFISSNLNGPTTWEYGTPADGANSGTETWETDLDGRIQNNEVNVLTSPGYLLSPELTGAELSFQLNYDLTLFQQSGTPVTDRWFQAAELNITNDNGVTWTKVTDFEEGGYNRSSGFIFNNANLDWPLWTDNSGGWITARVNMSNYVGQEVQFRVIVSTTSGFAGWFFGTGMKIDDWQLDELDNTAPTASFEVSQSVVNNSALAVEMSFSEEVSLTLSNLKSTNGTLSNLQTMDNIVYTFDVTPLSDGIVTVEIDEAVAAIEDLAGNELSNSPELTFLNDSSNPDVFLYSPDGPVFSSFTADIVFTKAISNFEQTDIIATNATLSNFQTTDNINYSVEVTPSATGTVSLSIPAMIAEDQFGNMNTASNSISIEFNPEVAPVLDVIGDQLIDENTELSFIVNATDSNAGQTISYSLDATSLGKGMTLDAMSGAFSWTPSEAQDGDHTVTVTAIDNSVGTLTDSETFTITVNEISQNPEISGPASWTLPEDAYASRSYLITDPDGQAVTVSLDANAQSLGFGVLDIINNPVVNKLIFWTAPLEVSQSTFDVTVTVTDGVGGSTEFVITMNVEEVNQLPALSPIGNQSVDELSELAFTVSGNDADLPAQSLAYSISAGMLDGMSIDDQTGTFSWTPTESQNGTHIVTFAIADDFTSDPGITTEEITITVYELNQAPILLPIGDKSIDEQSELTFIASATDSDLPVNDIVYSLDAASLSKGMTINDMTGAFSWTPTELQEGDHTVDLITTDDGIGNLTDNETIIITVNEVNKAPLLLLIGDKSIDEKSELTFIASATDSDVPVNDLVFTLDATSLSKGMTIDGMTGKFNWIPNESQDGDHMVTVTVTDDGAGSLSDDETISITVNEIPNVWNGTAWSDGVAPTGEDVLISSDYDFSIDGAFMANNLTINATLRVNNNETLIVNGNLENNNDLIIESGATLITYSSRTFSGNPVNVVRNTRHSDGRYSLVGAPFQQQSTNIGDDLGTLVYQYDESVSYQPNDGLNRWLTAGTDQLIPGRGYAQAGLKTLSLSGVPNTGTINYNGTYTGTYNDGLNEASEGWNLVANPYAAAINVQAFLDENTNLEGAVYIWDDNGSDVQRGTNADYVVANGVVATNTTPAGGQSRYNNHIGSAQGFFIKLADDTDTEVSFTEGMRISGNNADDNFFRNEIPPYVRVNLSNENGFFKQIILARVSGISDVQTDRAFDARVFDEENSTFYSIKANEFLAIQGFSSKEEISLGYSLPDGGLYTLSVDSEAFDGGMLSLFDDKSGITTNLNMESYHFTTNQGKVDDRFRLMFSPATITNSIEDLNQKIYSYTEKNRLEVFIIESFEGPLQIRLVDLAGRVVYNQSWPEHHSEISINTSELPKNVYLLQVSGLSTQWKSKVIIR